ncbi:MAG: phosphotransferase [Pyrinomonadaceae bacterium]|nr:phosphotransferase [Pyrinomonadaceae bacterium]
MVQSTPTTFNGFGKSARERLEDYVIRAGSKAELMTALTPDASTREYFRIPWQRRTAVAAVYPEPFDPEVHPFLDVTRLFAAAGLPIPEILDVVALQGIIVQEDLGDRQLRHVFATASVEEAESYTERAICLIADIQAATTRAAERNSIASRLAFDEAKLSWELDYFIKHYFTSYRRQELKHGEEAELRVEMNDLAADLSARPRVLCHRDFHSSNLMVDRANRLRVVDYQDARMGPATYDLVSLLLDRQLEPPSLAEVRERRLYFLEERQARGLSAIDPDDFAHEFRLMAVQRCLKAAGTFSYQTAVAGRGHLYEQFIRPMLRIVVQSAGWLDRFPALQTLLRGGLISQK